MVRVNVFAGGELDRAAHLRKDEAWLAARRADPWSRYVVVWRGECLVAEGEQPRVALLAGDAAGTLAPEPEHEVLLGVAGDVAHFAIDISGLDEDEARRRVAGLGDFMDLRAVGGLTPGGDAAMAAHARGMMYWHKRHGFCGVCGAPTEVREAGHLRVCSDETCAVPHFPRTDAAIIVIVADGERCLLGRQKSWPEGLYSSLAGFVEPGESLEEAVAREIMEESGIAVRDVRYHSSQPWPFPGSLMLGFHAVAATTTIDIDRDELDDARWFERDFLRNPTGGFRLPRPVSIARRLLDDWLEGV